MPRSRQYLDCSQVDNCFCPLLALQEQQQSAIFFCVIIFASFIMCSQLAHVFFEIAAGVNFSPQYTHCLSLSRTSFSSQCGMFQLFVMRLPCALVHNVQVKGPRYAGPENEANDLNRLLAGKYILALDLLWSDEGKIREYLLANVPHIDKHADSNG